MFSSSDLTPEQVQQITSWVGAGADLNDVQKKLDSELGISVTYMDTRFLILDLGLEIQTAPEPEEEAPVVDPEVEVLPAGADAAAGQLNVFLDDDPIPGTLMSGAVTFSDGEKGLWYIDQSGRPGLDANTPDYQPSEDDVMAFQKKLQALVMQRKDELA